MRAIALAALCGAAFLAVSSCGVTAQKAAGEKVGAEAGTDDEVPPKLEAGTEKNLAYNIVDGVSIPASLTGAPGDPAKGRAVAINRQQGNCLACHKMPVPEQAFHGEIGPDLTGIAERYTEGELRLRVVNPKILNEDTFMPAFFRDDGLHRVMKDFEGKTMLTAEQVEDVIAYLVTLKAQ